MKVILLEDIKGVGKKNEIVEAKQGYANNFLLPHNKAILATKANLAKLEKEKREKNKEKAKRKEASEKIADKLKEIDLELTTNVGEDGKLFGTITPKEISEELEKKHKIKIDRKRINVDAQIKEVGAYVVNVKLEEGVSASLRIIVKGI